MNKSVKLEPGTTEWNQTCYKDDTWSMLNCNGEFLRKDCSSAEIATCLGVLSYCRLKRTLPCTELTLETTFDEDRYEHFKVLSKNVLAICSITVGIPLSQQVSSSSKIWFGSSLLHSSKTKLRATAYLLSERCSYRDRTNSEYSLR